MSVSDRSGQSVVRDTFAAPEETSAQWILVGFLTVLTALRLLYLASGTLDLSPDEAHYWEWSRRLDLAYYSKGPLIAYLIRTLTATLGTSMLAIRLGAVLLSVAGTWVIFRLGREAYDDPRVGLLAAVGLQITPIFWAGSLLMTIDSPFLVLWTTALWSLYRAFVGGSRVAWIWAGVATGLGCLAKYTMLFVLPGVALYLWCAPEARCWLRRPMPYLAAAIVLIALLPVIAWNLEHDWVSVRHVASQGRGRGITWFWLVQFVGSQLGVLTPLIGGVLAWAAWHGARVGLIMGREPCRFLAAFATPILVFYLLLAVQGKVQANWAAAAYPPLALIAAGAMVAARAGLTRARRRAQTALLVVAGGLALTVTAAGHATDALGLPPKLDPTRRLKGWEELGSTVSELKRRMPRPERTFLLSGRYQITSELAFYVEGRPPAYNVNLGRRLNQYDFWEGPERRMGWDAIYVREGLGELEDSIRAAFERADGPLVVKVQRGGRTIRTFSVYRAYGLRGSAAAVGPTKY